MAHGRNVRGLYTRHGASLGTGRFLVKAVIYDIPSFIQTLKSCQTLEHEHDLINKGEMSSVQAVLSGRDWSNFIHVDSKGASADVSTVSATEVMQRLGVEDVPGLKERMAGMPSQSKQKLEERQKLEEIMGRGDSVRDKYMEKIRTKKMMAEARRERDRFNMNSTPTAQLGPSDRPWKVTPGSPALVRYLEERGISQALIARGDQSQLNDLLVELKNYKFQYLRNLPAVEVESDNSTTQATKSANHYSEILQTFCTTWGLPSWQVLLVIGDDAQDEALHKAISGSQFFVCKVKNLTHNENTNSAQKDLLSKGGDSLSKNVNSAQKDPLSKGGDSKKANSPRGLLNWFKRLSEGTLNEDDSRGRGVCNSKDIVHFKVKDMTELKCIIEDMNGVSYRTSTFVPGFR